MARWNGLKDKIKHIYIEIVLRKGDLMDEVNGNVRIMDKDRNGLAELEAPSCNIQEETRETHPFKGSKGNEDPSALAKTLQSCEIRSAQSNFVEITEKLRSESTTGYYEKIN
ncbi:hypothetical protein V1477_013990 [Vespula maculifrons]|uniref:Uncharacterized protein n=1 Tax=Vespula maculifrons TaxID=7453 RepID=A0ABD2BL93_VESMC